SHRSDLGLNCDGAELEPLAVLALNVGAQHIRAKTWQLDGYRWQGQDDALPFALFSKWWPPCCEASFHSKVDRVSVLILDRDGELMLDIGLVPRHQYAYGE